MNFYGLQGEKTPLAHPVCRDIGGIILEEKYLDLKSLSAHSSLGLSNLRDYIKKHGLPCFRVSGKILVQKSEFDRWLQRFRVRRNEDLNALVYEIVKDVKSSQYCLGKRRESRCGPEQPTR